MQKRIKLKQQLLVAGCTAMVLTTSGCRSAMPKWNLFAGRNAPSAETLAGNGPTITYPTPPSEGATPTSIASVAGGTSAPTTRSSIAQAGPSATNKSAAQANGFNLASSRTPASDVPGYASGSPAAIAKNASVPAVPAGYQFGNRTSAPATKPGGYKLPSSYPSPAAPSTSMASSPVATNNPLAAMPVGKPSSTASAYGLPQGVSPAAGSVSSSGTQNVGFELPTGAIPAPPSKPSMAGLAMPGDPTSAAASTASNAQPFTPKATSSFGLPKPGESPRSGSTFAMPASTGATKPAFSAASAQLTPRSSSPDAAPSSSYAPGSTSGATGYPATSGYPSTGTEGSFYR